MWHSRYSHVYRLGSHIPAPGVDVQATKDVGGQFGGNGVLGLLNMIVIGVTLETVRQAQAQAVMRTYGGYLKQAA